MLQTSYFDYKIKFVLRDWIINIGVDQDLSRVYPRGGSK